MSNIHDALESCYLSPLKTQPELFIGVELEFPIVNLTGEATDIELSKSLMNYLVNSCNFLIERCDSDGHPIQIRHLQSGDFILFEVSYNILEFAFAKAKIIQDVEQRFQGYLKIIQRFLRKGNHELQGYGIHPAWRKNNNSPVKSPRYQMLMAYLNLGSQFDCHSYFDYGAFICGNQVQLDVSRDNFLTVLNTFNKIEAAKAYLFHHSEFHELDLDTTIARDFFWEKSMHGLYTQNVGLFPHDFKTEQEFLDYLAQTVMFTVSRNKDIYYFPPVPVQSFFDSKNQKAFDLMGEEVLITPSIEDLVYHRAYHYQLLTRRGTIEYRSVCAQPLELTFVPTAFHLGLLENIGELENYLTEAPFFKAYGRNYPELRHHFSKKSLSNQEIGQVKTFSLDLIEIAIKGLEKRGFFEENYLTPLKKRLI